MTDRVPIGRVGKPHGLDGSFYVERPSTDDRWWKVGSRFLAGGEEAEVVGELPPTEDDEYYTFQLVGLDVVEENGRELGSVADVLPGVANDVLQVGDGVLLPMIEDCILSVDLDARRIVVAEGFAL